MHFPFDDQSFDVVVSAFMLMFVSEPEKVLSEMRRVLKPGGRLVVSVWQGLENNIVYDKLVETIREVAGDEFADSVAWPFTMGHTDRLERIFNSAGLDRVDVSEHDGTANFPSVEEFVTTEIQAWLLAGSMNEDQIDSIVTLMRTKYSPFENASGPVRFPLNALVVKAIRD